MKYFSKLVIIFLIISILFLSSCGLIKSILYNKTKQLLFSEKDIEIYGVNIISESDLIEWFDLDENFLFEMEKLNNSKAVSTYYMDILIFDSIDEAHNAFVIGIPYLRHSNVAVCRVNNIIVYSTYYYDCEKESAKQWKQKFDTLFQINENDFCDFIISKENIEIDSIDVDSIISYFMNNDDYVFEDIEIDDMYITSQFKPHYSMDRIYGVKSKKTNTYLTIQKYHLFEDDSYGYDIDEQKNRSICSIDIALLDMGDNSLNKKTIGIIIHDSQYLIKINNNEFLKLFKNNGWYKKK